MADLVIEAMFEHCGPRCDEFDPDCEGCRAWAQFDALEAEASEGVRRGLERALLDSIVAWHGTNGTEWRRKDNGPTAKMTRPEEYVPLRALIPEAPVRDGWLPISSVPRDGTKILLFFPTYKEGPVDVYRFNDPGGEDFPWETSDGWGSDVGDEDGPTHWRPLPAPPQDNREG